MSMPAQPGNTPTHQDITAAMSDFARLAIRASTAPATENDEIARLLLHRLVLLCGATRGALLHARFDTPESEQAGMARPPVHMRALALHEVKEGEIPPFVLTAPATPFTEQIFQVGADWIVSALPIREFASEMDGDHHGGHQQWAFLLLGLDPADDSAAARITTLCQATSDGALAVIQALLLSARVQEVTATWNDTQRSLTDALTAVADWEQVFDAVSDPVGIIGQDFRVIRANAALRSHLNRGEIDIIGHHCYAIDSNTDSPCAGCPLPQTMLSGKASFVQQEFVARSPVTGEPERRVYQRWTYPIVSVTGKVDRVVEILKDVTAQEHLREAAIRAEALRHADHLKAELLGTVSHELRSPLASIKGYAATLMRYERRLPRDERHEFLLAIEEATERLEIIISRLLEISQLETGTLPLQREPLDVAHTIREAVAVAESKAAGRAPGKFTFVTNLYGKDGHTTGTLPYIEADPRMIREVLDNLLENAVKYSPEGGTIEIAASPITIDDVDDLPIPGGSRTFHPGEQVLEITVRDMGTGIPSEHLGFIFDRFHRVDTRLTREVDGLGLGLAICKRITELHDGAIWAESSPGAGSVFHVVLPLEEALVSSR